MVLLRYIRCCDDAHDLEAEKDMSTPKFKSYSKGDQSWVFIGRTDVEAETPILWPPHVKSWLIGKDPDAGRDWGQEEKRMTEDEMAGWHHRLNGWEFEWTPEVGDGQGGLAYCSPWGRKESDMTERLDWTELKFKSVWDPVFHCQPCHPCHLETTLPSSPWRGCLWLLLLGPE